MFLIHKLRSCTMILVATALLTACTITNPLTEQALSLNPERINQITPDAGITSSASLLDERREAETSKYYVPTIPAVGGTVANHKNPKATPNNTAKVGLGGKNINNAITTPLIK